MKNYFWIGLFLLFLTHLAPGAKAAAAAESLTVYAAASLTGPLKQLATAFEKKTAVRIKTNFSSSGNLARQIEQGAAADIFFSASQKWMDYAEEKEMINPDTRINPIANTLVLISPAGKKPIKIIFKKNFPFSETFKGNLAIGDPDHVPAGRYARQALESLDWWEGMTKRLIRAKDVRQALMIVEVGEVEIGTVYGSDASQSDKIQVLGEFPQNLHDPIVYVAALCAASTNPDLSRQFLAYLTGEEAQEIFMTYGFKPIH